MTTRQTIAPARSIAMLLFPKATQLDFTGPFEVFARLPNTVVHIVASSMEPVITDRGLAMVPTATYDTCPPCDMIFVPGGPGQQDLMEDEPALAFLRSQARTAKYITSVCTGSLVLAAAGLLNGYRATSHWSVVPLLAEMGATPVRERVVVDRNRITGAGVVAGLDFALKLAAIVESEEIAREIQLQIEYDPDPPFDSGSLRTAAPELVTKLRERGKALFEKRSEVARRVGERLRSAL